MSRLLYHVTRFLAVQTVFLDHSTATRTLRWAKRVPQGTTEAASAFVPDATSVSSSLVSSDPASVSSSSITPATATAVDSTPSSVSSSDFSEKASDNGTVLALLQDTQERCAAHGDYFDFDKFQESEAGPWYAEWAYNAIQSNSRDWQNRVSEPQYFASQTLLWMDMDCTVSFKGCRNMPTCDEILARVHGNKTLARKVYFITQSFNTLNLIAGVISEQSLAAQTNCLGMASTMANTFFWKYDDAVQHKCDMLAGLFRAVLGAVFLGIMFAIPAVGTMALPIEAGVAVASMELIPVAETVSSEAEAVGAAEVAGAWAPGPETTGITNIGVKEGGFNAAIGRVAQRMRTIRGKVPSWIDELRDGATVANHKDLGLPKLEKPPPWKWTQKVPYRVADKWNKYVQPMQWQWPINSVLLTPPQFDSIAIQMSACKFFPNPSKDMPLLYEQQIDMLITTTTERFRSTLEEGIAVLNRGSGYGDKGAFQPDDTTALADQIILGQYVTLTHDARQRFLEEPSIIEHQMTSNFKNALISSFLKSQMCHLHCTNNIPKTSDGSDPCTLNGARFCPDPKTLCQAQCWKNTEAAKIVDVFGSDSMMKWGNEWDVTFQDFLKGSYEHWQRFRFEPTPMFPSVNELLNGTVTDRSGSFLPVCLDQVVAPHPLDEKDNVVIPCTCGDTYANETRIFFEDAGFNHWSKAADDPAAVGYTCAAVMEAARTHPVQEFLTECQLGAHWPLKRHGWDKLKNNPNRDPMDAGLDPYCEDMAQFVLHWTEDEGKSEAEINCLACFSDPVGQNIIDEQQRGMEFGFQVSHYNFWEGCRLFADRYEDKEPPCGLTKPQREVWDDMQQTVRDWDIGKDLSVGP